MTSLAAAIQPAGPPSLHGTYRERHCERCRWCSVPSGPERARQAAAALVLDTIDMRFDPAAIRARYPDLPLTSPFDVIARIAREKDRRPQ